MLLDLSIPSAQPAHPPESLLAVDPFPDPLSHPIHHGGQILTQGVPFISLPRPTGLTSLQHILPVTASLIIAPFTFPGSGAGDSNRGDL